MKGTTPAGAATEQDAAQWVWPAFGWLAPLRLGQPSFSQQHRLRWRRTPLGACAAPCRPAAVVLDICCGTGDLLMALERERGAAVWGSDFAIHAGGRAGRSRGGAAARNCSADVLAPPRPDALVDSSRSPLDSATWPTTKPASVRCGALRRAAWRPSWNFRSRRTGPRGIVRILPRRILPVIGGALTGSKMRTPICRNPCESFPRRANWRQRCAGSVSGRAFRAADGGDCGASSGARVIRSE